MPAPKTTQVLPGCTAAVLIAAPRPVERPQANRQACSKRRLGVDLGERDLRHHRVLGEGRAAHEVADLLAVAGDPGRAVGQVALVLLLADRHAEVGARVEAVHALAALRRPCTASTTRSNLCMAIQRAPDGAILPGSAGSARESGTSWVSQTFAESAPSCPRSPSPVIIPEAPLLDARPALFPCGLSTRARAMDTAKCRAGHDLRRLPGRGWSASRRAAAACGRRRIVCVDLSAGALTTPGVETDARAGDAVERIVE